MNLRRAVLEVQAHLIEMGYDTELGAGGIEVGKQGWIESIQLSVFYQTLCSRQAYTVELALSLTMIAMLTTSMVCKRRVHFIGEPIHFSNRLDQRYCDPAYIAREIHQEAMREKELVTRKENALAHSQQVDLRSAVRRSLPAQYTSRSMARMKAFGKEPPPKPKGVSAGWDSRRLT